MKKSILTAVLVTITLALTAQTKKVAVWETKCSDNSITPFQSAMVRGGMETAVANASGYIGYDRASFDAILKEQNFQRSGAVKDADIRQLGEMAGVQYIIVPEALVSGSDFYIIVKMLDVETGEYGAAYDTLCGSSASEIKKACCELGVKLFGSGRGGTYASTSPTNRPQSQSGNDTNDHEYIDLGLSSGTLWATCNVGASKPEDYGNYYAWGETSTKSTYNRTTYQYYNGCFYDENNAFIPYLTKYCNKSDYGNNGFTDNQTTLLPEDDAATANWGSSWRMPTKEEWIELYLNTTHTWTTRNGVNGMLFTASNGNSLFLPAAGRRSDSGLDNAGSVGSYWSRSLDTDCPLRVWYLIFASKGNIIATSRDSGRTVRPVRQK